MIQRRVVSTMQSVVLAVVVFEATYAAVILQNLHREWFWMHTALVVVVAALVISFAALTDFVSPRRRFLAWVLYLLVVICLHSLLNAMVTVKACDAEYDGDNVDIWVVGVDKNICTRSAVAQSVFPPPVRFFAALEAGNYKNVSDMIGEGSPPYTDFHQLILANTMSMRRALQSFLVESDAEWIVLLEDDAMPAVRDFERGLKCTLKQTRRDVIWLDVRTTMLWYIDGEFSRGATGMAYRRSFVVDVVEWMNPQGEHMVKAWTRWNGGYESATLDRVLSDMCTSGYARCAAAPLVRESGVGSTLGN